MVPKKTVKPQAIIQMEIIMNARSREVISMTNMCTV